MHVHVDEHVFLEEKEYCDSESPAKKCESCSAKFQRLRGIIAYIGNLKVCLR